MKILITGSNGLLGQKLVKLLANKEGINLFSHFYWRKQNKSYNWI